MSVPEVGLSRRQLLRRMGTGLGSLGLATLLAENGAAAPAAPVAGPLTPRAPHFKPRARHVIHLFMNGGPSQVDTFDPKPALEKYHGQKPPASAPRIERQMRAVMKSPFRFKKYGQSGIDVSELFPHVAQCVDDLCVIRSMHTNIPNHEPSLLMMTCGELQPIRPSMGSWITYGLGSENQNLPGFIVLCPGKPVIGPQLWSNSFLPGVYQGVHINNQRLQPRQVIPHVSNPYLTTRAQREQLDLLNQLNQMHLAQRAGDKPLEARIQSLEMAFRMQMEAKDVFDLSKETAATRRQYGSGAFAEACLVARRLVERGVRMVQVFYGDGQPWDDHADIRAHADKAKQSDQPVAALLRDLKARGLFDETVVLWGGEFGRTPTSEGAKGRDHNAAGFTVWLAGGGVRGGMTYGATDELGSTAVEKKVHVHDLHATLLHLLGVDHERLTYHYGGRDYRLTDVYGKVVQEILG